MTDKELRKLSRTELLEILIAQGRENLALQQQLEEARAALESRRLEIAECGSIAEASLKLSGVFAAAQQAIDQYRENCERECEAMLEAARRQAEDILALARQSGKEGAS
ncbi:MAG: DNA repair protein [Clostridia bacterium]|nr:DNA repair protein [Clostridia bacterium]